MIKDLKHGTIFYIGRKNKTNNNYCVKIDLIFKTNELCACRVIFSNDKALILPKKYFALTTDIDNKNFTKYNVYIEDNKMFFAEWQDLDVNKPFTEKEISINCFEEYYD